LETVANRSVPMACGPNVDQACPACGGSGAPHRGPCLARETPAGCPRQASPAWRSPCLGGALAGSGPGTSPFVDGLSLPAWWYPSTLRVQTKRTMVGTWTTGHHEADPSWCPEAGARRLGRWDSNPAPGCFTVQGRDGERRLTCDGDSPTLTARARRGPAVPDGVRIQHGPGSRASTSLGRCRVLASASSERAAELGSWPPSREVCRLPRDERVGGKEVRGLLDADLSRDRTHRLVEALNRLF
jgi:hypothetical protein